MATFNPFDEIQFPPELSYGARGGPVFNTTVVVTASGAESRNQNWKVGRVKWDVSTAIKGKADIIDVVAFFRARKGRARSFRFKDWVDYAVQDESIGTGNGSGTQFQLRRVYNDGLTTEYRIITKPVVDTVRMYLDGVETTSFVIDHTTGVVSFNTAPGDGVAVTADFEFDFPARFNTDNLSVAIDFFDGFVADAINIVEVLGEGVVQEAELGVTTGSPLN